MKKATWYEPKADRGWAQCTVGGNQGHNKFVGWYLQYDDAYGHPPGSFLASAYVLEVDPLTGNENTRSLGHGWCNSKKNAKQFVEEAVEAAADMRMTMGPA